MHKQKISILGAGNGGQAMAGHFAMLGYQICLYNRPTEKLNKIAAQNSILLNEAIEGIGYLDKITSSLKKAVEYADLIMITTTADAHKELALKMAGLVKDGQIIILNPGRTLGAIEFGVTIRKNTQKRIFVGEAQSLIYACRAELPGQVRVIGIKENVPLAAFPTSDTNCVLDAINSIYPCFTKAESVLETSLENIGAVLHPSVIIFNAAAIERGQSFYFYNDMTPAVADFIKQIDNERLSIGEAFGIKLKSVEEWISYAYKGAFDGDLLKKIRNNPAYYKILAPSSLNSRLLLEDIPTGVLPLIELGCLANVQTPLMESVLNIAQALLNKDCRYTGRTLKNLGFDQLNINKFMELL